MILNCHYIPKGYRQITKGKIRKGDMWENPMRDFTFLDAGKDEIGKPVDHFLVVIRYVKKQLNDFCYHEGTDWWDVVHSYDGTWSAYFKNNKVEHTARGFKSRQLGINYLKRNCWLPTKRKKS